MSNSLLTSEEIARTVAAVGEREYERGCRITDTEWFAALQTKWVNGCNETVEQMVSDLGRHDKSPFGCPGCAPLRALLVRARPAPRPPRES